MSRNAVTTGVTTVTEGTTIYTTYCPLPPAPGPAPSTAEESKPAESSPVPTTAAESFPAKLLLLNLPQLKKPLQRPLLLNLLAETAPAVSTAEAGAVLTLSQLLLVCWLWLLCFKFIRA